LLPCTRAFGAVAAALAATLALAHTALAGAEPIEVVLMTPLGGRQAPLGMAQRGALEPTIAAINARGGIAGRPLQMTVRDDGCARETATAAARDVATRPPLAVIGHPCAAAAKAAAPIYQQAGILLLAAGARHPALTESRAGPLAFRVSGRDDRQGIDAARRLRELAGKDGGVVMVHDRTAMARAIVGAAARALMASAPGGTAGPPSIGIVAGETDYGKAVGEVAAARPSAIFFAGFPAEAAILLRQLRAAGVHVPLLAIDANATPEFAAHAGSALASGVEVMLPVAVRPRSERGEAGRAPRSLTDIAAADALRALTMLAETANGIGTLAAADLARALAAIPADAADRLAFDAKGDVIAPAFAPYRWTSGAWRSLGPTP
jgi:branched-chain amino acid transport system substrate-binding protein